MRAALPASQGARRVQIVANLERWRWLPRVLPVARVEIRIPAYTLSRYAPNGARQDLAVIVGRRQTPSPSFAATIESLTLNPYWESPVSILRAELLPRFRRNPSAAASEGFEGVGRDGRVVDGGAIDWAANPFPYVLRQRPGPQNALGALRFNLPNPYAIYLHDTPAKDLLEREARAFSHGCIRVQAPLTLAASLLGDAWSSEQLSTQIASGDTTIISFPQPIPVYVLYLTSILDADGNLLLLKDIYKLDEAIAKAIDLRQARAASQNVEQSLACAAFGDRQG